MKPGSDKALARATAALRRAEAHAERGATDRALERAYAAIMHAARAVLNEMGERPRAHAAVAAGIEGRAPSGTEALRSALARAQSWRSEGVERLADDVQPFLHLADQAVAEAKHLLARGVS